AQFRITEVEVLAAGNFSAADSFAGVAASNPISEAGGQRIHFVHRGTSHHLDIPFMDSASVSNAMSCLCVLQALERWDPEHL
ncbi:MAG: hypothetical protein JZU67_07615, partial [Burkholderiaceae bacterium]|nr:hypothetical protein [Burkholderiaceae bacterium]